MSAKQFSLQSTPKNKYLMTKEVLHEIDRIKINVSMGRRQLITYQLKF